MWRNRNTQPQTPPDFWSQSIDWIDSCIPWDCFRNFRRRRWFYRCRTKDTNICCGLFTNCCGSNKQDSLEVTHEGRGGGPSGCDAQTSSRQSGASDGCLCITKSKHGPFCFGRWSRSYSANPTGVPKCNTGYSKLLHGPNHESPSNIEFPSNRCLNPVAFPRTNLNSINDIRLLSPSRNSALKNSGTEDKGSVVFFQGCCGYATFKSDCCTGHPYLSRCQSLSESLLSSKKNFEIVFFQGKCGYASFDSNCCRLLQTMHYNMREDSVNGNESRCSSPPHCHYFQKQTEKEIELAHVDVHARETTVTDFDQEGHSHGALPEILALSCDDLQQTSEPSGSNILRVCLEITNIKRDELALIHPDVTNLKDCAESQLQPCSYSPKFQNDETDTYKMTYRNLTWPEIECGCGVDENISSKARKSGSNEACNLKVHSQEIDGSSETKPDEPGKKFRNAENISCRAINSALNEISGSEEIVNVVHKPVKTEPAASKIPPKQTENISSELIQPTQDESKYSKDRSHVFEVSTKSETVTSEIQTRQTENISSVAVNSTLSEILDCKQTAGVVDELANTHLETSVKAENISPEALESSLALPIVLLESDVHKEPSPVSDCEVQNLAAEISFRAINAAMVECDNTENTAVCKSPQSRLNRLSERFGSPRVFDVGSGETVDAQMDCHDKELMFVHLTVSPAFEYDSLTGSSMLLDTDSDENTFSSQALDTMGRFGVQGLKNRLTDGCINPSTSCENVIDNQQTSGSHKDGSHTDDMTKGSDLKMTSSETDESYKQCQMISEHTSDATSDTSATPQRDARHICVQDDCDPVRMTSSFNLRNTKGGINDKTTEHRANHKHHRKKKRIKNKLNKQYGSTVDVSEPCDLLQKSLNVISKVNPQHKCYKKYERTTAAKSRISEEQARHDGRPGKNIRKQTKSGKCKYKAGKEDKNKKNASVTKRPKNMTAKHCKPMINQPGLGDTANTVNDDTCNMLESYPPEQLDSSQSRMVTDGRTSLLVQTENMNINMEKRHDCHHLAAQYSSSIKVIKDGCVCLLEDDTYKSKSLAEIKSQEDENHVQHPHKGVHSGSWNQKCEGSSDVKSQGCGEGPAKNEDLERCKNTRKQIRTVKPKRKADKVEKKKKTQSESMSHKETTAITCQPMVFQHEMDVGDYVSENDDNCMTLRKCKSDINSSQSRMGSELRKQIGEGMSHGMPSQTENATINLERRSDCHNFSGLESSSFGVIKDSFCVHENGKEKIKSLEKRKSEESINMVLNQLRVMSPQYESVEILQANAIPTERLDGKGNCKEDEGAIAFPSDEQFSLNSDSSDMTEMFLHIHKRPTKHFVSETHVPVSRRCKQLEKDRSQLSCLHETEHNTIKHLSGSIDQPQRLTHNTTGQSISSSTCAALSSPPLSNCIPGRPSKDTDKCLLNQSRGNKDLLYDPRVDIIVGESIVKALSDLTCHDLPAQTQPTLCAGNISNDHEKSIHKLKSEKAGSKRKKHHNHEKTKKNTTPGVVNRSSKVRKSSVNENIQSSSVLAPALQIPVMKSDDFHYQENQNTSQKGHECISQGVSRDKVINEENYNLLQETKNKTITHGPSVKSAIRENEDKHRQQNTYLESLVHDRQSKATREGMDDEIGRSGNDLYLPKTVSRGKHTTRPTTSRGSQIPDQSSQTHGNKKTKMQTPTPGHAVYIGSVKQPWINTQQAGVLRPCEKGNPPVETQVKSNGNGASESHTPCVATCEEADNHRAINKQAEGSRDPGSQQPSQSKRQTCVNSGSDKHRSDVGVSRRIHTDDSNLGTCKLGNSKKKQSRKRISSRNRDPCSIPPVSDLSGNVSRDHTENQRLNNSQGGSLLISFVNPEPKRTESVNKEEENTPHSHGSIVNKVVALECHSTEAANEAANEDATEAESTVLHDSLPDFSTDRQVSQRNVNSSLVYENEPGSETWTDFDKQPINRDSDAAIKISGDTEILTIENIDFSSEVELFSEQLSILHDNANTGDTQGAPNDSQQLDAYILSADKSNACCASGNSYISPYDDIGVSERQCNIEYGYNTCLYPSNSVSPIVINGSTATGGFFRYDPPSLVRDLLAEENNHHTGILSPCRYSLESRLSIDIAEGIVNGQEKDTTDSSCVSDYVREYSELCKSSIDTERRILKSVLESVRGCYSFDTTEDLTLPSTPLRLSGECSDNNQYRRNPCLIDYRTKDDDEELTSALSLFNATGTAIGSLSDNTQHIQSPKDNGGHILFRAIAEETDEELRAVFSLGLNRHVTTRERGTAFLDKRKRLQRQTRVEDVDELRDVTSKRIRQEGKRHPRCQGKTNRCDTRLKRDRANNIHKTASSGGAVTLRTPPLKSLNTKQLNRKGIAPTPNKTDKRHILKRHCTKPYGTGSTASSGNETRFESKHDIGGASHQNSLDDIVVVQKERNKKGGIVKKEKKCKAKQKVSYHDKAGKTYRKSTVSVKGENFDVGVLPSDDSKGFTPNLIGETIYDTMSYRNRKGSRGRGTKDRGRWSNNDDNNSDDRYEDVTDGRSSVGKLSRYSDTDRDIHVRKSPRYETHGNDEGVYDGGRFVDVTDDIDEADDGTGRRDRKPHPGSPDEYTVTPGNGVDSRTTVIRQSNSFLKEKVVSDEEYVTMIAQGKISFLQDLEGWREAYDLDPDIIKAEAGKLMAGDLRNLYRDLPERDRREVVRNIEHMDSMTHDDLMKSLRT